MTPDFLTTLSVRCHITPATGCWLWAGRTDQDGYARLNRTLAHRFVYMRVIGPIPEGFQIDHTCHNPGQCAGGSDCLHRRCVNPEHLEAVTPQVNTLRSGALSAINARKTHCPRGHPFDAANTYYGRSPCGGTFRRCRICKRAQDRVNGARRRRDVLR